MTHTAPQDPRLAAAREDVTLLADWLARAGREVPAAYRLLLSDDARARARGQERVAAGRALVLDGSLDLRTCLELARDDLAQRATPATAEGLRAVEAPGDPLFVLRQRALTDLADARRVDLIWGSSALGLAAMVGVAWAGALPGAAGLVGLGLVGLGLVGLGRAGLTGVRLARARRACRERRWSPVS